MRHVFLAALLIFGLGVTAAEAKVARPAFVQSDGSLKVGNKIFRLHGIHIPLFNRFCQDRIRPVRCGSRAVLQLEFRVDRFVVCEPVARNEDRSIDAVCTIDDRNDQLGPRVDLAAWMLFNGWAVALPNAPFEYITLERIAKQRERGIWGFQADSIRFR